MLKKAAERKKKKATKIKRKSRVENQKTEIILKSTKSTKKISLKARQV